MLISSHRCKRNPTKFVAHSLLQAAAVGQGMPVAALHHPEWLSYRHVLVAVDGPHVNITKIKPPMCFSRGDADTLVDALIEVGFTGQP